MDGITACRGPKCGKPIRWVLTEQGFQTPVDPDPTPEGTMVPVRHPQTGAYVVRFGVPVFHVLTGVERPALEPAWVPHWASCPDSPQFKARARRLAKRCLARECRELLDPVLVEQGLNYHPCCDPSAAVLPPERPSGPVRSPAGEQRGETLPGLDGPMPGRRLP